MTAPALRQYQNGVNAVSGDNLNTFMQTANLASDLRAFIGTTGIEVFMRGLAAVNDGGQGSFYWNGGASLTDDGVNVIVPYGTASGGWVRQTGTASLSAVRVVTVAGGVAVTSADGMIVLRKTAPATTTVTLPATPVTGETHTIKDGAGNAAAYAITISGNSKLIDGSASLVLSLNYEAVNLTFDGSYWNIW